MNNYVKSLTVHSVNTGHIQGIAIDENREFMYYSFTTTLVKTDMKGNVVGSVTGLAGHLGCIAYNYDDGRVYGSLEFKHDVIGKGILNLIGREDNIQDGFYIVSFDVTKINRMNMDAEKDGIMTATHLHEVLNDYTFNGHKYGCSGIDGTTFAPEFGCKGGKKYLYVSYGIYSDIERKDNDYQVILKYDVTNLKKYAKPLNQLAMHKSGPEKPDGKYFVFTGNTTYGIQNLEYDEYTGTIMAAVYKGVKKEFPNYCMYFIDVTKPATNKPLIGNNENGDVIKLANIGIRDEKTDIYGSNFEFGSTGMISLGNGYYYFSEPFGTGNEFNSTINLYTFDKNTFTFKKAK